MCMHELCMENKQAMCFNAMFICDVDPLMPPPAESVLRLTPPPPPPAPPHPSAPSLLASPLSATTPQDQASVTTWIRAVAKEWRWLFATSNIVNIRNETMFREQVLNSTQFWVSTPVGLCICICVFVGVMRVYMCEYGRSGCVLCSIRPCDAM